MSNKNLLYFDGDILRPLINDVAFGTGINFLPLQRSRFMTSTYCGILQFSVNSGVNYYTGLSYYAISTISIVYFGTNDPEDTAFLSSSITGYNQNNLGVGILSGKQLNLINGIHWQKDFDHTTQTNPTLFIHSDTDPDSDNTQWLGLTHDQTNGVISCGKGLLKLSAPLGVVNEAVAGDYIAFSLPTERLVAGSSAALIKSVRVFRSGTLRLKWEHKKTTADDNGNARIYRNGVAVGTVKAITSDSYVAQSDDVGGWNVGDTCDLYIQRGGSQPVYAKNFTVCEAVPAVPTLIADIDVP